MSATVIKTNEPNYDYKTVTSTVDIDEINQAVEYQSNYVPSYEWDISYYSATGDVSGEQGPAGEDGRGITSISFLSDSDGNDTPGDAGSTDTYRITYTDSTTKDFVVTNGADGIDGAAGADGTDGNSISAASGAPSGGSDGDLYVNTDNYDLYENQSGSWTIIGNIKGDTGDTGDTGPAGADGADGVSVNWLGSYASAPGTPSENDAYYNTAEGRSYVYDGAAWQTLVEDGDAWIYGTGSPTDSTVRAYNVNYIDTNTNDVYYKAAGASTWSNITTLTGAKYTTTSSDSINLDTITVGSTITVNIADDDMSYTAGQIIVVANTNSNRFYAEVDTYTGGTTISLVITHKRGTGTYSSWDLNLSGVPYSQEETERGKVFEVELPAYATTTQRVANVTSDQYPEGWTLTDGSAGGVTQDNPDDLIINHDITDSNGNPKPVFEARVMYKSTSSPDIYVSLVGDAAYTKLANDVTNGKVELASLTTEVYTLKIHLIFA